MEQALSSNSDRLMNVMYKILVIINLYQKPGGQMCSDKHITAACAVNPCNGFIDA